MAEKKAEAAPKAAMVRVEVTAKFKDKTADGKIRPRGLVYEVTEERFEELAKAGSFVRKTRKKVSEEK